MACAARSDADLSLDAMREAGLFVRRRQGSVAQSLESWTFLDGLNFWCPAYGCVRAIPSVATRKWGKCTDERRERARCRRTRDLDALFGRALATKGAIEQRVVCELQCRRDRERHGRADVLHDRAGNERARAPPREPHEVRRAGSERPL